MRITRDEMLMQMAEVATQRGTCSRAQVGVVVGRDGRVLVTGYNGAPRGMPHCDHTCTCDPSPIEFVLAHQTFEHAEGCPADVSGCTVATHAEINAITYAARLGIKLEGATLYTTLSPCLSCARAIINSGIREVVYRSCYRIADAIELLNEAGIPCWELGPNE